MVAATNKGLFRSNTKMFLTVDSSSSLADMKCVGAVSHGENVYILAGGGGTHGYVYRKTGLDSDFQDYPLSMRFTAPKAIVSHASGIYIACGDGIYRYTSLATTPEIILEYDAATVGGLDAVAVETLFKDRIVFAAKGATVYYYMDPRKVDSFNIDTDTGWSVKQLIAQPRKGVSGAIDLYILAQKSGSEPRVYAAYMRFSSQTQEDYSCIYGLEPAAENVDVIAYGNNNCYYVRNGSIYNASTGANAKIGNIVAYQMDYLPEDGSLAIVADTGLYLVNASTLQTTAYYRESGLKYVSQTSNTVYYASDSRLNAIIKLSGGRLDSFPTYIDVTGGVSGITSKDGAAGNELYILRKTDGKLLSVSNRYVYEAQ